MGILGLKKKNGHEYLIFWTLKGFFQSKLPPLHCAFLPNAKRFGYKIGIQFNNFPLVVERNNYTTKITNACIIYDIDKWP